jgi:L-glyceraldehyde 3-phosphate reductase
MFDRWIEDGLLDVLAETGIGCIGFSPLCQGILTDKYLKEKPDGSRAVKLAGRFHWGDQVSEERIARVRALNEIAAGRGQSMAQMAIAWVLRHPGMTSALIGASKVQQVEEAAGALNRLAFTDEELDAIERILAGA